MRFTLLLVLSVYVLSGCSSFGKSLKSFLGGDQPVKEVSEKRFGDRRFSENPNMPVDYHNRSYKTTTKKELEDQARVDDNSGSLWVMEGQGSYLFTQNRLRTIGDTVTVIMQGAPQKQLESKATVIKALLDKLNKPIKKPASVAGAAKPAAEKIAGAPSEQASPPDQASNENDKKDNKEGDSKDGEGGSKLTVDQIPSRITEKLADGSYRIKGVQSFMIGKNEYNAIVTGVIRTGDVADDKVEASKVQEPKFDIISIKKKPVGTSL